MDRWRLAGIAARGLQVRARRPNNPLQYSDSVSLAARIVDL